MCFHYCQLPTEDPEGSGNCDDSRRDISFVTAEEQDLQPQCQPQKKRVSCECFVLIFCHKQLSLKCYILSEFLESAFKLKCIASKNDVDCFMKNVLSGIVVLWCLGMWEVCSSVHTSGMDFGNILYWKLKREI